MKKSFVLSIIMTLVMVVAMSTATYAWYTSNHSVEATGAELTASTAAGNVTIGHTAQTATYTSISWVDSEDVDLGSEAAKITDPYAPMMPVNDGVLAADDYSATHLGNFATAVKSANDSLDYTSGQRAAKYVFYLSNEDSDAINLSITCRNVSDASNNFRWAIVTKVNDVDTVISRSAYTYLTDIEIGDATNYTVDNEPIKTASAKNGTYNLGKDAQGIEFTIYVWFSGDAMTNANSGTKAGFDISITQA